MNFWLAHLTFLLCIGLFIISVFVAQPRFEGLDVLTFDLSHIIPQSVYDPLYMIDPMNEGIGLNDTSFCDKYTLYLNGLDGESVTNGLSKFYEFNGTRPLWLHSIFYNESSIVRYHGTLIPIASEKSINLPITREQFDTVVQNLRKVRLNSMSLAALYLLGMIILLFYCIGTWSCDVLEECPTASAFFALGVCIASGFFVYYGSVTASLGIGAQSLVTNEFMKTSSLYGITVVEGKALPGLLYTLALAPLAVVFWSFVYVFYVKVREDQ